MIERIASFQDFYVLISSTPFGSSSLTTARGLAQHEYYEPTFASTAKRKTSFNNLNATGQYVRIQAVGTAMLKFAEVEVIGKTYIEPIALPLELVDFTAQAAPNGQLESILNWTTLAEQGVSHFEVQHLLPILKSLRLKSSLEESYLLFLLWG